MRRERKRVQTFFEGPSMARPEFKDQCDLAQIIKKYAKTPEGAELLLNLNLGATAPNLSFGDVSNVPGLQVARNLLMQAQASFDALPARLRERFSNDAAYFADFCSDPANAEEMKSLGLVKSAPQDAVKTQQTSTGENQSK